MEFRVCPSFPNYEASACGIVRRLPFTRVLKDGSESHRPTIVVKRVARDGCNVVIDGRQIAWTKVVADAWSVAIDPYVPASKGARIISLADYLQQHRG